MSRRQKTIAAPVASLEARALLSGNVNVKWVSSSGGWDIEVTGDSSANSIEIVQPSLDNYLIRGKSGTNTKINGVLGRTFSFQFDDFDDVTINMGSGNDYLAIVGNEKSPAYGDLDFTDDLTINMGSGTDTVNLKFMEVKGDFSINLGDGNDKFNSLNNAYRASYNANGGNGSDKYNRYGNIYDGSLNYTSFLTPTSVSTTWF